MTRKRERTFGQVVRQRRRLLDLTQQDVAAQVKTSTPYIGHLESGKRRPSDRVVARLAEVLGLDRRELFLLANPGAAEMLATEAASVAASVWDNFRRDQKLRRLYNIAPDEIDLLGRVAEMGNVNSSRDFVYVLLAVRLAVGR